MWNTSICRTGNGNPPPKKPPQRRQSDEPANAPDTPDTPDGAGEEGAA